MWSIGEINDWSRKSSWPVLCAAVVAHQHLLSGPKGYHKGGRMLKVVSGTAWGQKGTLVLYVRWSLWSWVLLLTYAMSLQAVGAACSIPLPTLPVTCHHLGKHWALYEGGRVLSSDLLAALARAITVYTLSAPESPQRWPSAFWFSRDNATGKCSALLYFDNKLHFLLIRVCLASSGVLWFYLNIRNISCMSF